jgi:hypothetical protein
MKCTGNITLQVITWLVVLATIGGLVYGTYVWQHREVDRLDQQVAQLTKELAMARQQPLPTTNTHVSQKGVKVVVYTPTSNNQLTSPVVVMGEAPGNWSFEASFPVKLLDSKGNQIAQAPAHLLGDWMTDKLVPFSVTLTFVTTTKGDGTLLLQKDNPSGLPTNDDTVSIPIKL